jgi:hypothetical protein
VPSPATIEAPRADEVADAVVYFVTRERRVAVNAILIRAGDQTWYRRSLVFAHRVVLGERHPAGWCRS